jgi:hypothetical protein
VGAVSVLSEKNRQRLEEFLAAPAEDYDPDGPRGTDPHSKILTWALDPEYGGLPALSGRSFANWLSNCWADWTEEPGATVKDVLEGAVSDWCGGRSF